MYRPSFSGRGKRLVWLGGGAAALLVLYTVLGFWVAPRVLRRQATEFVREEYGRSLGLGEIRVHPFKLYVEIKHFALPDADGKPLITFERLFLDFQALSSIGHWAYVFREITLEKPALSTVVRPDGRLNLADLAGKPDPEEEEEEEGLPDVWVQTLNVDRGGFSFSDRARPREFNERLTPLSFSLRDFRTTQHGGKFALRASSEDGARLWWKGSLSVTPVLETTGKLAIAGAPLRKIAEYLGDALPFGVTRGRLELRVSYRAQLGAQLRAQAKLSELTLHGVALRARGEREPWVRVAGLAVHDAHLVLEKRALDIQRLSVTGLSADARLEPDGTLNLQRLLGPKRPEQPTRSAAAPPAQPDWTVQLRLAELRGATLNLEDRAIAPGTKLSVTPVQLEARELSLELGKPVPIRLTAAFDEGDAQLSVSGTVTPEPLSADLEVRLDDARLALAQPYLAPYANLTIRDGTLELQGQLALRPPRAEQPELAFTGRASLVGLRTSDPAIQKDFVNAARIELSGVRYALSPDSLSIAQVNLVKPYARVILGSNQVLNVTAVFAVDEKQEARGQDQALASAEPSTQQATEQPAKESMPVRIDTVRVQGMRLNFADYFIKPNFAAEIQALHGSLRGLSSDPRSRAAISLQGKLGENSPVSITGKTQVFAYDQASDINLRCTNIELAVFNPYSGRFAGYNIARGELATDIKYVVRRRQISAQHKIRIDQLAWGEETDSKEAAPLPVKLATVLLRDRDGVISLDLPVTGSLDDPKFRVWPVIWQVVKNVIVKAATAPFDLLGSLFRGAEKARYIEFAPGEATLDDSAREGLAALTNAMLERPDLRLQVPLGTDPALDRSALVERRFQERVRVTMQSALRRREKRDVRSYDELDAERKGKVLSELYEEVAGKEPKIREPKLPKELSRSEQRAAKSAHAVEFLEQATRERIEVAPEELDALGRQRAQAIESALLASGKLDHTRILVSQKAKVSSEQGKVRFELGFE